MNYFEMEIQKYWAPPASMPKDTFREHLELCIAKKNYIWSEKFDGNFSRAVITKERSVLQTRGISKKTLTYGEIQDKVFFWDDVVKAFSNGDTVLLGEVYLPNGIDKDVGKIVRCLTDKARLRQSKHKLEWIIFDVLVLDGVELIEKPIEERVSYIQEVVKRINNPLVKGVQYHQMDEDFFENIDEIFLRGGEGAVCYKKGVKYRPGKRSSAWDTIKVKKTLHYDVDCFIYGTEPAIEEYTGKDVGSWLLWKDMKTGEKLQGEYYSDYYLGKRSLMPITKGHYNDWAGAIYCAVYDENNNPYIICKCAGLTEDFKEELKNNYDKYHMMPLKITGMMVSDSNGYSIRHPKIVSLRENDIDIRDCSLEKIKAQL